MVLCSRTSPVNLAKERVYSSAWFSSDSLQSLFSPFSDSSRVFPVQRQGATDSTRPGESHTYSCGSKTTLPISANQSRKHKTCNSSPTIQRRRADRVLVQVR